MHDATEWLRSEFALHKLDVEVEGKWICRDCRSQRRERYVELSLEEVKRLRREKAERAGHPGA